MSIPEGDYNLLFTDADGYQGVYVSADGRLLGAPPKGEYPASVFTVKSTGSSGAIALYQGDRAVWFDKSGDIFRAQTTQPATPLLAREQATGGAYLLFLDTAPQPPVVKNKHMHGLGVDPGPASEGTVFTFSRVPSR
jgi:hypothetical protein